MPRGSGVEDFVREEGYVMDFLVGGMEGVDREGEKRSEDRTQRRIMNIMVIVRLIIRDITHASRCACSCGSWICVSL